MSKGGGGAWKVAYADFITAMMALFMVLWILGSEDELLEQLQEYFRNPPSPFTQQSGKFVVETGDFSGHTGTDATEAFFDKVDPVILKGIVNEFYRVLDMDASEDRKPPVDITVTSDGLRVSLFDRHDTPLFQKGSLEMTDWADFLVQNLAWLIARYSFDVVVESHSGELDLQSKDAWQEDFGPWELSVERANLMRRRLQFYANDALHFRRVSGFGSGKPVTEIERRKGHTDQRITLSLSLTEGEALPDLSSFEDDLSRAARRSRSTRSAQ